MTALLGMLEVILMMSEQQTAADRLFQQASLHLPLTVLLLTCDTPDQHIRSLGLLHVAKHKQNQVNCPYYNMDLLIFSYQHCVLCFARWLQPSCLCQGQSRQQGRGLRECALLSLQKEGPLLS